MSSHREGDNGSVTPSDADLVRRCRAGDRAAFDPLVLRHQDRVYNAILRFTGDRDRTYDVAQKTFLNAWLKIREFKGDAAFGTWLYRIAFNLAVSEFRSRPRERGASFGDPEEGGLPEPAADLPAPGDRLAVTETQRSVQAAIRELDEEFRQVVVLRDIEGLAYEEVAAALGIAVGTVRSRLHRGRAELKDRLKKVAGTIFEMDASKP